MEHRRLGRSGLIVSAIGLGTNNFGSRVDPSQAKRIVDQAIELGVNFFDTADLYGGGRSEELLGAAIGSRRSDVVIATKFGMAEGKNPFQQGAGRKWILEAIDGSLRRLRTDYLDLYQVHQPDPGTSILETLQCLDDLVRAGKIRYHGHSNFKAFQIADAEWTSRTEHLVRPISAQHHYNLIRRDAQAEVLPACAAYELGFIPFFPLASGFLTGKYRPGEAPKDGRLIATQDTSEILTGDNYDRLERFEQFAKERDHSLLELAFGWLLSQSQVTTVIASASRPEQIAANVGSSSWRLTDEELAMVETI